MGSELDSLLDNNTKAKLLVMDGAEGAKKAWSNKKIAQWIVDAPARARADAAREAVTEDPQPAAEAEPTPKGAVVFECSDPHRGVKVKVKGQRVRLEFQPHFREDTGETVGRLTVTDKAIAKTLVAGGYKAPQPVAAETEVDLSVLD